MVFCLVAFNYLGFKTYLKSQKKIFRQQLITASSHLVEQKKVSKDCLFKNANGIEWHENNKEISINGTFYEVLKVEEVNDSAIIYVIKDEKENALFAGYFEKQNKNNDFIISMIKILFGLNHYNPDMIASGNNSTVNYPRFNIAEFFSVYPSEIIKPPITA